jgi:hypothetical protein
MSFTLSVVATKRNEEKRREEKKKQHAEIFFWQKSGVKKAPNSTLKFCPCKIETIDTTNHTIIRVRRRKKQTMRFCI